MNWFWKWLGYHVCEDFTPWEQGRMSVTLTPLIDGVPRADVSHTYYRMAQSRQCKSCGKTEIRGIKVK